MANLNFDHALNCLLSAATHNQDSNDVFAQTMYRLLMPIISFDSSSLNLCQVDDRRVYQLPELKCYFHRQPQKMALSCQKDCWNDNFSRVALKYPYHAFDGARLLSMDEWREHPHYLSHDRYFDVGNAMVIAGKFPNHLNKYLILYFYKSDSISFDEDNMAMTEQVFPYLFSLWQYRLGFICSETLTGRYQLLQITAKRPKLFQLIQLIVRNPLGTNKDYARALKVSERTVEHQLSSLYEQQKLDGYGKNKKFEIFKRFQFLEV